MNTAHTSTIHTLSAPILSLFPLADASRKTERYRNSQQNLELEFLCRGAGTKASRTELRVGSSLRFYLAFLRCGEVVLDFCEEVRKIEEHAG